jgi:hypothetical protein
MGLSLGLGKKGKMRKLIGNYVKERVREKRAFDEQIRRLEAQLKDEQIDQQIHERLRGILETQYYQKRQKQWAKVKNKFQNPLN